ncbi:MAG: ribbon-helix-helix domain-containing protein [Methanothrix sp.]
MSESTQSKRVAVTLPEETRIFLDQEAKETGVPLSNLLSYIATNYVREEKRKRS